MTFSTTIHKGVTRYFVDGYRVPQDVYDTLFPSKLFPVDTGLSLEVAEARFAGIKAAMDSIHEFKPFTDLPTIRGDKPLKSDALACHSSQRAAIMARNAKHGIHVNYDGQGRPVFTDKGQRKALMRLEKVRSMNSYDGY